MASAEFIIKVDFREARLYLYDEGKEVASFSVALPRVNPKLPITGRVEGVEENPYWAPTKATREYYFKKSGVELPELIRPGDPRNAMGNVKIRIAFNEARVNQTIRIHGTNQEESIGRRVSRGCIRMRNDDIKKLSEIIRGEKTVVVFN
ncbi:MAG: L,D-transpeptidase [Patescibacteria group bacterium]